MQPLSSHTACGKIILFGEHFVVHGSPAVAMPLTARGTTVEIFRDPAGGTDRLESQAPGADLDLAKELFAVALEQTGFHAREGLLARVRSTLPVGYGLGSSASFAVALCGALLRAAAKESTVERLNQLALGLEQITHGNPSGIDNTVVTLRVPVFFRRDEEPKTLCLPAPPLLLLASSGAPGSTKEAVSRVGQAQRADPSGFARRCDRASELVTRGARALEAGDQEALGLLMDQNHALLAELGVSTPGIETLVAAARNAGALGAKVTGSGRGGFIVALVQPAREEAVARSLEQAGSPLVIRP